MTGIRPFEMEHSLDLEKAQEVIDRPLKREWIKKRSAGGGRTLDYLEGGRVKKLLIEAFQNKWSWEIVHWEIKDASDKKFKTGTPQEQPPYVIVHGRLTVPGVGTREAFGSKVIQMSEGSDQQSQALKSASTDAFKVAASYFGIGLDLYLDDAEYEEAPKEQPKTEVANKYKDAKPTKTPASKSPTWSQEDLDKMASLKKLMNIADNEGLNAFVQDWSGGTSKSYKDINPENIKAFNKYLEGKVQG